MDKDPKSPNNDVEMNDDNDFEMENEQTLFPNLEDLPSRSNFEAYLSAVGGGSNSKNKRDMMEADDDDGDSKM